MTDSAARLVVAVDFAQPESYLALAPTLALSEELHTRFGIDVEVDWRAMTSPLLPRPPSARELAERGGSDRTARHLLLRARYRERDLVRYAAVQGITLGNLERTTDSRLAGIALHWLEQRAPHRVTDYVKRVFEGHWNDTLDIESTDALRGVITTLGVEMPGHETELEWGSMVAGYDDIQADLHEAGVLGAPCYVVDGEVFLGRAHLPMIRWLLRDRRGPTPI